MTDIINAQNRRDNAINAINNSNMSEDEKTAAINKVNNDFNYVVQTTLIKGQQTQTTSSTSSGGNSTSTSGSGLGGGFSADDLEEVLDNTAIEGLEGLYYIGKLIPPLVTAVYAFGNLNNINNTPFYNQQFLNPEISKISLGLCAIWAGLSIYGSYLSERNKRLKRIVPKFSTDQIIWTGFQQLAALACIGFVFGYSMDEFIKLDDKIKETENKIILDKNDLIKRETNVVFLMAAAGLVYQATSCHLKRKKIHIRKQDYFARDSVFQKG